MAIHYTRDLDKLLNEQKYLPANYTGQYKFKLLKGLFLELGFVVDIVTIRTPPRKHMYKYQVEIGYEIIKVYKTRYAAKTRILKEYLKRKKLYDASKS